jgi:ribonuclease HI
VNEIVIYTDGGAIGNPGPGGYGAILIFPDGDKIELSGGTRYTTNNRMELQGAIRALESISEGSKAILTSDSKYLVEAINQKWLPSWKKREWMRSSGPLVNADLWKRLDELLMSRSVKFFWIKGHTGHIHNERCDVLAGIAMRKSNLPPDPGYVGTVNTPISSMKVPTATKPGPKTKITKPGQLCWKCGQPVEQKKSKHHEPKPGQFFYYDWYLHCPGCGTNYMVENAKRNY